MKTQNCVEVREILADKSNILTKHFDSVVYYLQYVQKRLSLYYGSQQSIFKTVVHKNLVQALIWNDINTIQKVFLL